MPFEELETITKANAPPQATVTDRYDQHLIDWLVWLALSRDPKMRRVAIDALARYVMYG